MFRKVIGTLGTRILSAALTFGIWILNAHVLGPEKVGTISLIIFSVAIIQLFTNFFSGSALIYLAPREGVFRLIVPAFILTPVTAIAAAFLLKAAEMAWPVLGVIPEGYFTEVLILGLVMSMASVNYMLLLGKEKVSAFNVSNLVQIILLASVLPFMLFVLSERSVMAYCHAILWSYLAAFLVSLAWLAPTIKPSPLRGMKHVIGEMVRFGTFVQLANVFQTMNYRLSLKIVDRFLGRGAVGILSLGMALAEGLWMISKSIGTVQYSRLSNAMDFDYSVRLTLTFAKIAWFFTTFCMVILLLIPGEIYGLIFSDAFTGIKLVIASLAPGIIMLSVSIVLSGFFSAINRPYQNTIASAAGFVVTITAGLVLVPLIGITGAGLTASFSYTMVTLWQLYAFSRMSRLSLRDFMITGKEMRLVLDLVSEWKGRSRKIQ